MPIWLTFVRSEEEDPLRLLPSTISLHDHSLWGLFSCLFLLGRIPISKWGLRPNTKVQAFAPTMVKLREWVFHFGLNLILSFHLHFMCFVSIRRAILICNAFYWLTKWPYYYYFFPEYRPKEAFIKKEALIKMYT